MSRVPLQSTGGSSPANPQGFAADPDYWKGEVFAYVGLPQNLKDLKDLEPRAHPIHRRNSFTNPIHRRNSFTSPIHRRN